MAKSKCPNCLNSLDESFKLDLTPSWSAVMRIIILLIESHGKPSLFKDSSLGDKKRTMSAFRYIKSELTKVGQYLDGLNNRE